MNTTIYYNSAVSGDERRQQLYNQLAQRCGATRFSLVIDRSKERNSVGLDQRPDFDVCYFCRARQLKRSHYHLSDTSACSSSSGSYFRPSVW